MNGKPLCIGNMTIAGNECVRIIAEIAQAHDGSLGAAHAMIDAAVDAGADAVKFQTHIAAAESTLREPWRVKFSRQDATRYEYWRRMEFSENQWQELKAHCDERGVIFLSSPFSPEAVDLLGRVGVPAWKVASGEIGNLPLLRRMAATGLPMILSSGMSAWEELDRAVAICRKASVPFAVMQCTTAYPCPPERVGLNVLAEMRERYSCPVGLSDHSGMIYPGLAAAALGSSMIEVHVAFHKKAFGPDTLASLTFEQLAELVQGTRFIAASLANPVDKNAEASKSELLRKTFGKSIVARKDLAAGAVLTDDDLALKKPGTGLPPSAWPQVLGKRLNRALSKDEELALTDLGEPS
jgi:N,N'-diacetyllegionaminate synthase